MPEDNIKMNLEMVCSATLTCTYEQSPNILRLNVRHAMCGQSCVSSTASRSVSVPVADGIKDRVL
jgi:DsbC/DsbD-like thiol-disulfide interchange protein